MTGLLAPESSCVRSALEFFFFEKMKLKCWEKLMVAVGLSWLEDRITNWEASLPLP